MLAMHRSGLKFSLRSWVLTQGLTSAQGKFARSRNQRGITTLCATCQRENPVLSTSCSPCVHMKWRARIQIYINKLFNWFFFSLLSCVINPAEFQSSSVCLQSMSIFTPTDGFSFSYLSRAFFFSGMDIWNTSQWNHLFSTDSHMLSLLLLSYSGIYSVIFSIS